VVRPRGVGEASIADRTLQHQRNRESNRRRSLRIARTISSGDLGCAIGGDADERTHGSRHPQPTPHFRDAELGRSGSMIAGAVRVEALSNRCGARRFQAPGLSLAARFRSSCAASATYDSQAAASTAEPAAAEVRLRATQLDESMAASVARIAASRPASAAGGVSGMRAAARLAA
jgi:hypothetical protein